MKISRRPAFTPIIMVAFIVSVLLGLAILSGIGGSGIAGAGQFGYGTRNLVGATPEEIGRFAQQYAEHNLKISGDTPQVLLARAIKRPDLAVLGIACLPSSSTIEDPPLTLVILKGQFDFSAMPGSAPQAQSVVGTNSVYKYIAYVFDMWSAEPTFLLGSVDGGQFHMALDDSSLPITGSSVPLVCPTEAPHTVTLHYGDSPPTPSLPPLPPTPYTSPTALPTAPAPIATNGIR
jgi:hypothetical protein